MGYIKSLAQGFLVGTGLIWLLNVAALMQGGDAWLGLTYLLILLIPISTVLLLKTQARATQANDSAKWRNLLFSFQGAALGFWMFDLFTTFYAINITGLAVEINPLGWPLGILGALAFYGPTLVFSYMLLFKFKEKMCLYAAIPLTVLTLIMSSMNLIAGVQNFQVFVDTAMLAAGIRYSMLSVLVTLNVAVPLALNRLTSLTKPQLNVKKG